MFADEFRVESSQVLVEKGRAVVTDREPKQFAGGDESHRATQFPSD